MPNMTDDWMNEEEHDEPNFRGRDTGDNYKPPKKEKWVRKNNRYVLDKE
jgi:hypothetical protein